MQPVRQLLVLLHRYAGLTIAGFLFMSGITGAVISWDHELDDLLNSHILHATSQGTPIDPMELASRVEARDARMRVTYVPLGTEPGDSLGIGLDPRVDPATGRLFKTGYNEVYLDPVTGAELGRRHLDVVWPLTRENFVSFLYLFHYTLHLPEMWGIDKWGQWLLGSVAVIWALDCFVGFYLTLPARRRAPGALWWQRWRPAWTVRWGATPTKVNFDLHRAFSLWTWALLFILAFTAFSLNLRNEVFFPMMSAVSEVTPSPYDVRTEQGSQDPIWPGIGRGEILDLARDEARRRGWNQPAGGVFYSPHYGIYEVAFFEPGRDDDAGGVGPPVLYFDGASGQLLGDRQPWKGTAADLFSQAQFPLHSGRILGLPGRILISLMGLVVATLSVTGVVIWLKKRRAVQNKPQRSSTMMIARAGLLFAVGILAAASAHSETPQHLQKFPVTSYLKATRWAPCAFDLSNPTDRRAECAFVMVPLDYSKPARGTYRVMVKRIKATKPATAHVWLLHGGPGASATEDLKRLSFGIPDLRPDISYYGVDHRGMGGSERLGCPPSTVPDSDIRGKWAECMESLKKTVGVERLNQIGTSNAARDIGTLIAKYREPGVKVIVNGLSYGTTLAHRYMQIFPEQPDGVILIGIEVGSGVLETNGVVEEYGHNWDRRSEDAISKIFERCALAEECARHFDKHPWQVARETMASLYKGHCSELGIEADRIKETLGAISYATPPASLPALISRLKRCNEADRTFLRAVVDRWYPSMSELGTATEARSDAAGNIISASESIPHEVSAEAAQREFRELTIAYGVERFYVLTNDLWPKYPRDEFLGSWAPYTRPMLMMQGGLDTATTLSQALVVRARYHGANQNWVVFPEGNHQIVDRTPTLDGTDCGRSIFIQFVDDPKRTLDRSCLARLTPIDWNDSKGARASFGVNDLWNGVPEAK